MKTQYLDSSVPLQAEAGLSWKLIAENETLTDVKMRPYTTLRVTALAAAVKITVDGVPAIIIPAGQSLTINTGLGDPTDKKSVKVTTDQPCNMSAAIDAPLDRSQESVEE